MIIPGSPEQRLEERIDRLISEMDELMVVARHRPSLIESQSIGIGQIAFRAQLILSWLEARKAPMLKVVKNG